MLALLCFRRKQAACPFCFLRGMAGWMVYSGNGLHHELLSIWGAGFLCVSFSRGTCMSTQLHHLNHHNG
jgi:hypothetical protein